MLIFTLVMKFSKAAAKILVRLFFILILIALLPFLTGDAGGLKHVYLNTDNKLALAAPILLLISFIILLVICTRARYEEADLNWVLIINILILMAYGITVFIRIRQAMSHGPATAILFSCLP